MKTSVEIPAQRISDVLVSAFEGGSNYWYDDLVFARSKSDEPYDAFITRIIEEGSGAVFSLVDKEDQNKKYHISVRKIKVGVQKMAQHATQHFADILSENDDSVTGDVLLQYIVLGYLIYG